MNNKKIKVFIVVCFCAFNTAIFQGILFIKVNKYFINCIDCFRNIAVVSLCKFHYKLSFFPFFHVKFDFYFLLFSQIMKEFKRIADWDLMSRLNEGLQKYGRTILKRKASHTKLKQLRQNIAACRLEETRKCKYEL